MKPENTDTSLPYSLISCISWYPDPGNPESGSLMKTDDMKQFTFLIIILMSLLLPSCNDRDNEFSIGQDFIESATNIIIIDTFSLEVSTVIQDSVSTSGTGAMLIGDYSDTLFGNTNCNSYFQIGLPEQTSIPEDDYYDSISLIFYYSGYSYGDTNQLLSISVHQLSEPIEPYSDGYLYNTSSISYSMTEMGKIQVWPSPKRTDSIEIKINDMIGKELFFKFQERSAEILSRENFLEYFNGIALIGNESTNNAIIGFKAGEANLKIRLYTHRIDETQKEIMYDFPLINPENQFNQIRYNFNNTLLSHSGNEKTAIPSTQTGERTFVQGYRKIMTKIQFPTLQELLLNEKGIILKAELEFHPVKSSYTEFALPDFVMLYETNQYNRPGDYILDSEGNVQTATLFLDELYNEETYYTINVSDFIKDDLSDSYFDTEHGLLISLYNESYKLNLERMVIETKNPAPRLKITYLTY